MGWGQGEGGTLRDSSHQTRGPDYFTPSPAPPFPNPWPGKAEPSRWGGGRMRRESLWGPSGAPELVVDPRPLPA